MNFFNLGGSRSDPAPLKQIQKQGSKNGDPKTGIQNGDAKMSGTFQFSDLGHFNKFGVKQSGRVNGGWIGQFLLWELFYKIGFRLKP